MIKAEFLLSHEKDILGFHIKGHSGFDSSGRDIICAFVSSAAYMTANTVTEIIGVDAVAEENDGEMLVRVDKKDAAKCRDVFQGLKLHLINTEEQYPNYLKVIFTEV
jgi:hypothetical protein